MARLRMTMACDWAIPRISLALDHELSPIEQAALDRHLEQCANCRAKELELTGITRLMREAPLLTFERRPVLSSQPRVRRRAVLLGGSAAAAALSVAAGLAAILLSGPLAGKATNSASPFRTSAERMQFLRMEESRMEPVELAQVLLVPALYAARSL